MTCRDRLHSQDGDKHPAAMQPAWRRHGHRHASIAYRLALVEPGEGVAAISLKGPGELGLRWWPCLLVAWAAP